MRAAGKFNAQLMDFIRPAVKPGVKTEELDRLVDQYTRDHGHAPACLGYPGDQRPFPKSCCISINDVVCHGIPGKYELKPGDVVNIDLTTIVEGWHGDQSETFLIGESDAISEEARAVTQCAFDSLYLAINSITPGCQISVIGEVIVEFVRKKYGFGVVDKYVGHGIGTKFHQRPNIPHVPTRQAYQERLFPGMCFTIEPMINGGSAKTVNDPHDGWTVRTSDGRLSAQFEHTILMTERGPEILTLTTHGPQPGHVF
jgi:methionyl aminopeptidase